jgi:signal peptidase
MDDPSVSRQLLNGVGWAIAVAGVLLAAAIALPLAFGARPQTVLTGSMEPAISAGDVVIDERVSPLSAELGDVVTFRDPEDQSRLITHRVIGIRRDGSHLWFRTQGDANNTTERWRISSRGELGRVAYVVPWVGHAAVLARTPLGLSLFLLVPLLLLAVEELWRIWRPRCEEGVPGAAG